MPSAELISRRSGPPKRSSTIWLLPRIKFFNSRSASSHVGHVDLAGFVEFRGEFNGSFRRVSSGRERWRSSSASGAWREKIPRKCPRFSQEARLFRQPQKRFVDGRCAGCAPLALPAGRSQPGATTRRSQPDHLVQRPGHEGGRRCNWSIAYVHGRQIMP
jgi:hypothetical protein